MKYNITKRLKLVDFENETFIWNCIFSQPMIINKKLANKLTDLKKKSSIMNEYDIFSKDIWDALIERKILKPVDVDERDILLKENLEFIAKYTPKITNNLAIITTDNCNLNCKHCILLRTRKAANRKIEGVFTAENMIKAINNFKCYNKAQKNYISLVGAEPTLCWIEISKTLKYFEKQIKSGILQFSMVSNLVNIDHKIINDIINYDISIITSMDGPPNIDIKIRPLRDSISQKKLVETIKILNLSDKKHVYHINIFINQNNFDYITSNFILWLKKELLIDSIYLTTDTLTNISDKNLHTLIQKYEELYILGLKNGITIKADLFVPFDNFFKNRFSYCDAMSGSGLSVYPNGDITTCNLSTNYIGNNYDFCNINIPKLKTFYLENMRGANSECINCELEGICAGGCYLIREYSKNINQDFLYISKCKAYREMTKRLIIQKLKNRRPK